MITTNCYLKDIKIHFYITDLQQIPSVLAESPTHFLFSSFKLQFYYLCWQYQCLSLVSSM